MHALIEARRSEIEALCRRLGVRRLDVFGSAVDDSFDVDTSDVDMLVESTPSAGASTISARTSTCRKALSGSWVARWTLPASPVSATRYFRDRVMSTREPLYAACPRKYLGTR